MTLEIKIPEPLISVGQKVVLITEDKKDYMTVSYGSVGVVKEVITNDRFTVEFPEGLVTIGAEDLFSFIQDPDKVDYPELYRVNVNKDRPNTTEKVHPATCVHDWYGIKEEPTLRFCTKCFEFIVSVVKIRESLSKEVLPDKVVRLVKKEDLKGPIGYVLKIRENSNRLVNFFFFGLYEVSEKSLIGVGPGGTTNPYDTVIYKGNGKDLMEEESSSVFLEYGFPDCECTSSPPGAIGLDGVRCSNCGGVVKSEVKRELPVVYQLHPGTRDSKGNLIGVETDWLDYLQAIVQILKLEDYELVWVKLDDGTEPYLAIPTKMLEKQEDPLICVGKAILTKNYNSEFSYNNDKNSVARILTSRWIEKSKELEYHREEDNLSFLEKYRLRGDILVDRTNKRMYCVPAGDDQITQKVLIEAPFSYSYSHINNYINRDIEEHLEATVDEDFSDSHFIYKIKKYHCVEKEGFFQIYRHGSQKPVHRLNTEYYDQEITDTAIIFRPKPEDSDDEEPIKKESSFHFYDKFRYYVKERENYFCVYNKLSEGPVSRYDKNIYSFEDTVDKLVFRPKPEEGSDLNGNISNGFDI